MELEYILFIWVLLPWVKSLIYYVLRLSDSAKKQNLTKRKLRTPIENLCITLEGSPELIAGQSKSDGSDYLERFGLRTYVLSKTGIIGMHVSLTDYPYADCRKEEILKVSGDLQLEPQSALNFIDQLRKLCTGQTNEAVLVGRE